MGDDLVTDGILPSGSVTADDEDPNMVESDDFLDDPDDVIVSDATLPIDDLADDDDEPLEDE